MGGVAALAFGAEALGTEAAVVGAEALGAGALEAGALGAEAAGAGALGAEAIGGGVGTLGVIGAEGLNALELAAAAPELAAPVATGVVDAGGTPKWACLARPPKCKTSTTLRRLPCRKVRTSPTSCWRPASANSNLRRVFIRT